jgi:hypothetical protein
MSVSSLALLLLSLLHVGREVPRTAMEHIEIDRHLELSRDPSDAEPPGPGPGKIKVVPWFDSVFPGTSISFLAKLIVFASIFTVPCPSLVQFQLHFGPLMAWSGVLHCENKFRG